MDTEGGRDRRRFLRESLPAFGGAVGIGTLLPTASGAAARRFVALPRVLTGTKPPGARLGKTGDFYVNTVTHQLYGPKQRSRRGRNAWGRPLSLPVLTGPQGPPGAAGANGADGLSRQYSVLAGAGPPASSVGVDGDFYIDTATAQIFGPRSSGSWGSPTSITGPIAGEPGGLATLNRRGTLTENQLPGTVVTDSEGDQTITTPSKTESALILKGADSQEVALLQVHDSSGAPRVRLFPGSNSEVHHGLELIEEQTAGVAPELNFYGKNGAWFIGMDVANAPGNKDFVLLGKRSQNRMAAHDLIYVKDNDEGATEKAPLVGFGVTPPVTSKYNQWQFSSVDSDAALGTIGIRVPSQQTGNVLTVYDSGGTDKVWLTSAYRWKGESGVKFQATGTEDSGPRALTLLNSEATAEYGFEFNGKNLFFRYISGGVSPLGFLTSGAIVLGYAGGKVGFFGAEGVARPTIEGSRDGNTALADLLTKLAASGLITNSTSA